jgi:hypothetical protein
LFSSKISNDKSIQEQTPLITSSNSIHKSSSYGNKSDVSSNHVEEDYGENDDEYHSYHHNETDLVPLGGNRNQHPIPNDNSWAASSNDESGDDSDDENSASSSYEEDSESSESSLDEEVPPIPPPVKIQKKESVRDVKQKKKTRGFKKESSRSRAWHEKTPLTLKRGDSDDEEEDNEEILIRPRRNCCHSFFIFIQITAILGNLAMLAIQMLPIIMSSKSLDTLQIVIRCYFTVFILMMILAEMDVIKGGLGNWIVRGFLMTFLGVVAFEQETVALTVLNRDAYWGAVWSSVFFQVVSWWMIGVGCLYFLMGMLCMKRILQRCRDGYQRRIIEYKKDLKAQLRRH